MISEYTVYAFVEGVAYVSGGYCGRCGKPPFHAKIAIKKDEPNT